MPKAMPAYYYYACLYSDGLSIILLYQNMMHGIDIIIGATEVTLLRYMYTMIIDSTLALASLFLLCACMHPYTVKSIYLC